MKTGRITIAVAAVFIAGKAMAQSPYPNFDFETGGLSGWTGFTGTCCPIGTPVNGFKPLRHTVVTGTGTDPYSLGQLPMVAPGGNHSLRLGNDSVHSEAERIAYTLTVDSQATLLVYRYAVVLEFPANHPPSKQPRFEVTVRDQQGQLIDCGYYHVVSSDHIPGFYSNGDYRIKPWTDVGVDLSAFVGKQITIEFSTGDCGMGGHFGYAYIDGNAASTEIKTGGCNPDGSITLTAPPGFQYAWSTGQTTQQITLQHYNGGQVIGVTLQSYSGCYTDLSMTLPATVARADFAHELHCDMAVGFTDLTAAAQPITSWLWDFGDGQQAHAAGVQHVYAAPGSYPVALTIESGGCRSVFTSVIPVDHLVKPGFDMREPGPVCAGTVVHFSDLSIATKGSIQSRYWEFGDYSQSEARDPSHVYIQAGAYLVSLVVTTTEGCSASLQKILTINPEDSCFQTDGMLFVPKAFTPNGDGINDYFTASGHGAEILGLDVYDRWGRQVYSGSGSRSRWDGRERNRKPAPDGVYTYNITARLPERTVRQITGYVVLLH